MSLTMTCDRCGRTTTDLQREQWESDVRAPGWYTDACGGDYCGEPCYPSDLGYRYGPMRERPPWSRIIEMAYPDPYWFDLTAFPPVPAGGTVEFTYGQARRGVSRHGGEPSPAR